MIKNILSIAGIDITNSSGIQTDIKTFSFFNFFGISIITSLVLQNSIGIIKIIPLNNNVIIDQINYIFKDIRIDVIKIGFIPNLIIAKNIYKNIKNNSKCLIILDPIIYSTSNYNLISKRTINFIKKKFLSNSKIITPNLIESKILISNKKKYFLNIKYILNKLYNMGAKWILLKGGHINNKYSIDFLFGGNNKIIKFYNSKIITKNTRGTGCNLSSIISIFITKFNIIKSVYLAKKYISLYLKNSNKLQNGHNYCALNHFVKN